MSADVYETREIPEERAEAIRAAFARAEGREPGEPIEVDADVIEEVGERLPDGALEPPDPAGFLTFEYGAGRAEDPCDSLLEAEGEYDRFVGGGR